MIVSQALYLWWITAMVGGLGLAWAVVDTVRLRRALKDDPTDPIVRDRIFGSIIGLCCAAIGIIGAVQYHL